MKRRFFTKKEKKIEKCDMTSVILEKKPRKYLKVQEILRSGNLAEH